MRNAQVRPAPWSADAPSPPRNRTRRTVSAQRTPLDAVGVQHSRVRGKAGPDRRGGVVARPVDELPRVGQYGSSCRSAARGSVPVTTRPSRRLSRSSATSRYRAAVSCGRDRRAERPAARRAAGARRHRRRRPRSSTNWRSVASSAASGMLLTSPMSMQLRLRNSTAAVSAGVVPGEAAFPFALPYSAAMSGDARRAARRPAPGRDRRGCRRCARCRC